MFWGFLKWPQIHQILINFNLEDEKRSFLQFNFKTFNEAEEFKKRIKNINSYTEAITYANSENIKYNKFDKLNKDEIIEEISQSLFTLSLNDSSGESVKKDSDILKKITNKVYEIESKSKNKLNLFFKTLNSPELDSIIIMSKFYPWIIKYSMLKNLDPDKPRYLTKVTNTF